MPIVIWGSRGLTSTLDRGRFYCPRCDRERNYDLKQTRPWFTLYFIPLFPVGAAQRYVECQTCEGGFTEEVLNIEPPSEADRLLARVHEDLEGGTSLDDAEDKLVKMGMDKTKARDIVADLAGDDTWSCNGCNRRYLKSVKRCRECRNA